MNSVGRIAAANSSNSGKPSGRSRNNRSGMNTGTSRASARRKSGSICSRSRSGSQSGSDDSTRVAPSFCAEHGFDLGRRGGGDRQRRLGAGRRQHRLADDADAHARERAQGAAHPSVARIGRRQHRRARHRGVRVAPVVIAGDRVLQRVEHLGAVADSTGENAGAVAIDVGADRPAVEAEHRLVRQDQGDGVVIGRAAGRGAGLLAEARHDQIGADRHARPRGRAERGGARRVVGVGRVAAPARALIAEHRGQYLLGPVPPARIAGAAVVFGATPPWRRRSPPCRAIARPAHGRAPENRCHRPRRRRRWCACPWCRTGP